MNAGTLAVICSLLTSLGGGIAPQEATPAVEPKPTRIAVIGVTILTDFQRTSEGEIEANGFEDAVLIIEDGAVKTVLPRQNFQLRVTDIVVSGRGRFAMAAPIIFGAGEKQGSQWLRGRNLLAAGISGVGCLALPKSLAESPAGRCAESRIEAKEFPGALPVSFGNIEPEDPAVPMFEFAPLDATKPKMALYLRLIAHTRSLQKAGHSNETILFGLTNAAAARIERSDLGVIEPGARGRIVVSDGNPLDDPSVIFDPHAVVFGDRVLRRSEIEVLRDSSSKGAQQISATHTLELPGEEGNAITRWLVSVAAQVFGGVAMKQVDGEYAFASTQGEPRFDRASGWLRESGEVGYLEYTGSSTNFRFTASATAEGLSIELSLNDQEPIKADSAGASTPPLMELAADLALRAASLTQGKREFNVQELIYGQGPIGLAPRRLRFTPVDPSECPPCFLDQGDVWRLEVLDPEQPELPAASTAMVAFRNGLPTRIRIDSTFGPSWYDQLNAHSVSLD